MTGDADTSARGDAGSDDPLYRTQYDAETKLSTRVVEAFAAAVGTSPLDLDFALYDCLDPDALDALFAAKTDGEARIGGEVVFVVEGYEITVDSDGEIVVRGGELASPTEPETGAD